MQCRSRSCLRKDRIEARSATLPLKNVCLPLRSIGARPTLPPIARAEDGVSRDQLVDRGLGQLVH